MNTSTKSDKGSRLSCSQRLRLLILCVLGFGVTWLPAQGVLNFATLAVGPGGSVDAPGTNASTFPYYPASGVNVAGQLYVGPAGITDPLLLSTNTGAEALRFSSTFYGYIGSTFEGAGPRVLAGYAPGTTITVQLRAWLGHAAGEPGSYDSWEQAPENLRTALSGPGAPSLIQVTLGDGVNFTPNLVGMQGYNIGSIPEPSSWAILAMGGVAFCIRRWRRTHSRRQTMR